MLLHPVEPKIIVNGSFQGLANRHRAVAQVYDGTAPLPDIQHPDSAQGAGICRLSAAFGVEGGLIQDHFKAPVTRLAA